MKRQLMAGSLIFAAVTACVSTQAVRLGSGPVRPPVPPDKVAIYLDAKQVPGKYDEVALLSSSGDAAMTNEEKMYKSMREKAGEMGANGVILEDVKEPGTGSKVAHALIGTTADRKGKAIAIFVYATDSTSKH